MIDPYIQTLLDSPIGGEHLMHATNTRSSEAREAARRASKIWLPDGKRSPASREAKEARQALKECQLDIADAIEAAGGERGHMGQ